MHIVSFNNSSHSLTISIVDSYVSNVISSSYVLADPSAKMYFVGAVLLLCVEFEDKVFTLLSMRDLWRRNFRMGDLNLILGLTTCSFSFIDTFSSKSKLTFLIRRSLSAESIIRAPSTVTGFGLPRWWFPLFSTPHPTLFRFPFKFPL